MLQSSQVKPPLDVKMLIGIMRLSTLKLCQKELLLFISC